jgi:hypothetical protein
VRGSPLDDYEVAARARVDGLEVELDRISKELAAAREVLSHVEITRATLSAVAAAQPPAASGVVIGYRLGRVDDRSIDRSGFRCGVRG